MAQTGLTAQGRFATIWANSGKLFQGLVVSDLGPPRGHALIELRGAGQVPPGEGLDGLLNRLRGGGQVGQPVALFRFLQSLLVAIHEDEPPDRDVPRALQEERNAGAVTATQPGQFSRRSTRLRFRNEGV